MKAKQSLALITLGFISIGSAQSQTSLTTKDSIATFYDVLLKTMKTDYLYRDSVNWIDVEMELSESLKDQTSFEGSLSQIRPLLGKLNADHCQIFYKDSSYTAMAREVSESDFSDQWLKKYMTSPEFEVKVIDDKYGYILIPAINFEDISSKNIHRISQPWYDTVNAVKSTHDLEGWIIDLRFNTGGNSFPMMLALYDLLGDTIISGGLDVDGKRIEKVSLKNGKLMSNNKVTSYIKPSGKKLNQEKVAIITGMITASSGEIVAIAFKGRQHVIYIGEETMGMTTSNEKRNLPFGSYMALTTGIDCDRNQKVYEKIIPDVEILKEDNFDDMLSDRNIKEAVSFFKKK